MTAKPRNFRRRAGDDDGDEGDNPAATTSTTNGPSTTSAAKPTAPKPKKPPTQTPKLLSFADDEDSGAGARARSRSSKASGFGRISSSSSRPAKPPSAHTMTSLKDRVFHSSSSSSSASLMSRSLTSNVQPQAGTYTMEALRELQKNTRTLAASSKPSPEPVIVLKGPIKPAEPAKETNSSDSEDDEARNRGDGDGLAAMRLAAMGIGGGKGRDSDSAGSLIPDKATIEAIRAKRERLRQSRAAAPDFISLDAGSNHGEAEGLSDEEPENLSRIAMLGEKVEGPRKGVFEGFDERAAALDVVVSEAEEDEEAKMWEEEQFRKGLGKNIIDDSGVGVSAVQREAVAIPGGARTAAASASIGGAFGGSSQGPGLGTMSMSQQGEIVKKSVLDNVRKLKVC